MTIAKKMNMNETNNSNVRLAFFGTAPLAADILSELEAAGFRPAFVVASPDKVLSRGKKIVFPIENSGRSTTAFRSRSRTSSTMSSSRASKPNHGTYLSSPHTEK